MSNESWRDIMSLVGLVILAENRASKDEAEIFVKAAIGLNNAVNPGLFLTHEMARGWFNDNKDRLNKTLQSSVRNSKIDHILGNLSRVPNQREILSVIEDLASTNMNYRRSDHFIISRAEQLWQSPAVD